MRLRTVASSLLAYVAMTSVNVHAEDAYALYPIDEIKSNEMKLRIYSSDNVDKTCDSEAKKRGFPPYGIKVDACTFWSGDFKTCDIYFPKKVSNDILGHELRHCLHGAFHKW